MHIGQRSTHRVAEPMAVRQLDDANMRGCAFGGILPAKSSLVDRIPMARVLVDYTSSPARHFILIAIAVMGSYAIAYDDQLAVTCAERIF